MLAINLKVITEVKVYYNKRRKRNEKENQTNKIYY